MPMDKELITIAEAAELIGVTEGRISQLIGSGRLDAVRQGTRRMVSLASARRYRDSPRKPGTRPRGSAAESRTYMLMCADYEVARVSYDPTSGYPLVAQEVLDVDRMPFGTVTRGAVPRKREFCEWWEHRSVPDTRPGLALRMPELGVETSWEIPLRSLGLSLSDCYWLRPDGREDVTWAAVNYFDNDFVGSDAQDWDRWLGNVGLDSPDNTSEGELPKRWNIREGRRVLLKGCGIDDQRLFNEVVATALHRRLLRSGEFVPYELVRLKGGPACLCADFLGPREEYIPAAYVRRSLGTTRGSSYYDRFCRYAGTLTGDEGGVRVAMAQLIVCDALIANVGRHWRNFGFVRNIDTLAMRPAPLFDSGNSLWYMKTRPEVEARDWSFVARPFGPEPDRQLALVDETSWFDAAALDGFVDEARNVLSGSEHASASGRLDYIAQGLTERVRNVTVAMGVLAYRQSGR